MPVARKKQVNHMLFSIENKRKEMILSGKKTGLTSKETLKYSMELDKLIYSYQIQLINK
ncbi:aspartyl-phosphate phosphatase Spo0E family protein [Pueribacillus sp. YX66]|uniref:aspartyl-phosphate phosphatase Spo0E family protein n=1 Tax=Pueribacillus sp. YX66 TaxID=3229242 RepID=UPI00358D7D6A